MSTFTPSVSQCFQKTTTNKTWNINFANSFTLNYSATYSKILAPAAALLREGVETDVGIEDLREIHCSQVRHQVRLEDNSKVVGPDSNRGIFWQVTQAAKCECV